ncbi:uncharacterized protein LOC116135056 [Pistacia vera]|uniref:uncharacterized protein LOC116135056 n=1 Tax=Pistacia vera TaxID=55513 RepID=UPI001262C25F|nr:uncharacterized protein LOC116135056 [Pistacia vera]
MPNFIFTCAPNFIANGLATGVTVVVGLARGKVGLPSHQFAAAFTFDRKFAICLISSSSSNGVIIFGDGAYVLLDASKSLTYTPLLINLVATTSGFFLGDESVEYFIGVTSIKIGGLKEDELKYKVLRETLGYPSLVGLLDLVWNKLKVQNLKNDNKDYRCLVNNYIKEYIDWGAKKTVDASIGVSTRKEHHKKLGVPLPRVNYKLDKDLRIKIIRSFPVYGMWQYS